MKVNVSDALNQNNACLFLCKAEIFSNVIKTSIQLIFRPTVFLILSSIAPIIPIKVTALIAYSQECSTHQGESSRASLNAQSIIQIALSVMTKDALDVIKTSIQLIFRPTVFLILSSIAPIIPIKVTALIAYSQECSTHQGGSSRAS